MRRINFVNFLSIVICFLCLSILYSLTGVSEAVAQTPSTKISCDKTSDEEFHSLRPYQANIECATKTADYASFCGNDLTLTDTIEVFYQGGGNCTRDIEGNDVKCYFDVEVGPKHVEIDLSGADLPIMGNTEDVINFENAEDIINNADKMNEYVSWYLNGVTDRSEYGSESNSSDNLVNYSGPINKLLPQVIQQAQQIKMIESATGENVSSGVETSDEKQHDKIVVCTSGDDDPVGCYDKEGNTQKYRLSDWKGDISFVRYISNSFRGAIRAILPGLTDELLDGLVGEAWNKKVPPLPWEYDNEKEYLKAFHEWQGDSCVLVLDQLLCIDNPLVKNKWSELFTYIPLSSAEDVEGEIKVDSVSSADNYAGDGTSVSNVVFTNQTSATLYLAHMPESDQLGELLQSTYVPEGKSKVGTPTNVENATCNSLEVRSNAGDDMFATSITGDLSYRAKFSCIFEPLGSVTTSAPCTSHPDASCVPSGWECGVTFGTGTVAGCSKENYKCGVGCSQSCKKDVQIHLSTESKIPYVDDIWSRLVAGGMSIFKKIFPKTNTEGSVGQIMDIPGSTSVTYTGTTVSVSPATADLKLPHLGGISEYFLKGIQTALRPKGYGEDIMFAENSGSSSCVEGVVPNLPSGGLCTLSNGRDLPVTETFKKILEAAGKTYNVPPSLILGVMYGEGAFNDAGTWTEENVIDWASCGEMPNCSNSTSSIVHIFGNTWDNIAKNILPDLKKLDPSKTKADPCNLLDITYATAKMLKDNAGGSSELSGKKCLGITMSSTIPTSCNWTDSQYETAIRVWEFGTAWGNTSNGFLTCATQKSSCLLGGGVSAQCSTDTLSKTDTCDNSSAANSHNRCVWDVAHGN